MKYKVSIVGAIDKGGLTGHTNPKIFLYQKALNELNFDVSLFSTKIKKIFFIKIIFNILSAFRFGDTVIFMLGGAGCRKLSPLIIFLNKFYKKRIILNPFGTGTLNPLLKNKDINFVHDFISEKKFGNLKDGKLGKVLDKYDLIMLETQTLIDCYRKFYNLNNLFLVTNFRFCTTATTIENNYDNKALKIIFLSRVAEEKGILELMETINFLNSSKNQIFLLDIFGNIHLDEDSLTRFNNMIKDSRNYINYRGIVPNDKVQQVIKKYDLSCLPTKAGEGAPGFIIESLIAGVPVLTSSYSQVYDLISDNTNGFIFKLGDFTSLKNKLVYLAENKNQLFFMRENVLKSGERFTFDFIKNDLVFCVTGEKIK